MRGRLEIPRRSTSGARHVRYGNGIKIRYCKRQPVTVYRLPFTVHRLPVDRSICQSGLCTGYKGDFVRRYFRNWTMECLREILWFTRKIPLFTWFSTAAVFLPKNNNHFVKCVLNVDQRKYLKYTMLPFMYLLLNISPHNLCL